MIERQIDIDTPDGMTTTFICHPERGGPHPVILFFMDAPAIPGAVGTLGYCMSGQFAINAAANFPDRVSAAASMYGTYLVTDQADSPHIQAHKTKAELYFGCAETDRWAPPETVAALWESVKGLPNAEVEIYDGVEHGFAFPQRAAYDKAAAERHWERLSALYRRRLG
jgi:carboxymethylenebutenolidase